jgi:hypothetical protein
MLRGHLEDAGTWGAGAAQMQREMNAAFTPMIPARGALERFTDEDPFNRARNGWDQARRANRQQLRSIVDAAADPTHQNERADLLRGAQLYSDWAATMQRLHQGDQAAGAAMQQEAARMLSLIDTLQTDARARGLLEQATEAVGSLGVGKRSIDLTTMVQMLRRFRDNPRAAANTNAGRVFAEMWPSLERTVRRVTVETIGDRGDGADSHQPDDTELFNQILEANAETDTDDAALFDEILRANEEEEQQ